MIKLDSSQPVPLRTDDTGTVRVVGSRVTLDTVVGHFTQGYTAEEIQESFPSLRLEHIYSILAYYLTHQADVSAYLDERERQAEEIRAFWEGQTGVQALKAKLRAVRSQRLAQEAEPAT